MASGEYGDERQRPHYHAIIFGENFFEDRRPSKMSADYFESELLDELWQHQGACVIGDVTFDSANYVAGYTVKKLNGKYGVEAYENMGRIPPFGCMSTKPAIGKRWVEKHLDELVQHDTVIVNGAEQQPPRYYDEYVKKWCPDTYREIKNARVARSRERLANGVAGQSIAGTKTRQNFVARKNSTL